MTVITSIENKKQIEVVALALFNIKTNKYLIVRRAQNQSGAGEWEFPGGKIENNETQQQALRREIIEELGFTIDVNNLVYIEKNQIVLNDKNIVIYLWNYQIDYYPDFSLVDHDAKEWVSLAEFKNYSISKADEYFISLLKFN